MRLFQESCFDDFVVGALPTYSSTALDTILGRFDRLAVQLFASQVGGISPRITLWFEHSADGRRWAEKGSVPAISSEVIAPSTTNVFAGEDISGVPSLTFVRLRINLEGTAPRAVVRVFVCGRGSGMRSGAVEVPSDKVPIALGGPARMERRALHPLIEKSLRRQGR